MKTLKNILVVVGLFVVGCLFLGGCHIGGAEAGLSLTGKIQDTETIGASAKRETSLASDGTRVTKTTLGGIPDSDHYRQDRVARD